MKLCPSVHHQVNRHQADDVLMLVKLAMSYSVLYFVLSVSISFITLFAFLVIWFLVPPVFQIHPLEEIEVRVAESIRLECYASGIPDPEITWKHNDSILPTIGDMLIIKEAEIVHNGTYECIAENDAGKISSVTNILVKGNCFILIL